MDFSLFAHMERTSADQDQRALRGDLIALAKMADEGGMRAIWTGERLPTSNETAAMTMPGVQ